MFFSIIGYVGARHFRLPDHPPVGSTTGRVFLDLVPARFSSASPTAVARGLPRDVPNVVLLRSQNDVLLVAEARVPRVFTRFLGDGTALVLIYSNATICDLQQCKNIWSDQITP